MNWEQSLPQIVFQEYKQMKPIIKTVYGQRLKFPYGYRLNHIIHTVRLSLYLQTQEGGDRDVILAAAWLHDIAKIRNPFVRNHGEKGAVMAANILATLDFPHNKLLTVKQVIRNHVGLFLDDPIDHLESAIVWDADKLTKISCVGLINWFSVTDYYGTIDDTGVLYSMKNWRKTSEKILESFSTSTAQELGNQLLTKRLRMETDLEDELNLADVPYLQQTIEKFIQWESRFET